MKAEGKRQQAEVALAELLRYPNEDLARRVAHAIDALIEDRDALEEVTAFYDEVENVTVCGMEELYTRTFDLNPVATLDLGWHLYGEQYERGRFLAELREREVKAGIDAGTELPDHITAILLLIAATHDDKLAAHVRPALEKIRKPLDEHGNPYRHLIAAAELLVAGRRSPVAEEVQC